jgi:uncharacterized membrane protein YoaK (UPF0700 family)
MFRTFIINMLSGQHGPSSKRGVMVWLLLLFTFIVIIDMFTGKHPQEMYSEQVFELLIIAMGIVFGEKFVSIFTLARNQKLTTKTTVVAPPDATVVNTEVKKEPGAITT